MKAISGIKLALAFIIVAAAACRNSRSSHNPSDQGSIFSRLPSGAEPSNPGSNQTRSGSVSSSNSRHLPPGQAKKVYGHQSAKAFAPGQQKKKRNTGEKTKKSKTKAK